MKIFLVLFLVAIVGTLTSCADTRLKANCDIRNTKEEDKTILSKQLEECYRNPSIGLIKRF